MMKLKIENDTTNSKHKPIPKWRWCDRTVIKTQNTELAIGFTRMVGIVDDGCQHQSESNQRVVQTIVLMIGRASKQLHDCHYDMRCVFKVVEGNVLVPVEGKTIDALREKIQQAGFHAIAL